MKITVFSCIQFIYFMSGESSLQAEINIPSVQLYIVYIVAFTLLPMLQMLQMWAVRIISYLFQNNHKNVSTNF